MYSHYHYHEQSRLMFMQSMGFRVSYCRQKLWQLEQQWNFPVVTTLHEYIIYYYIGTLGKQMVMLATHIHDCAHYCDNIYTTVCHCRFHYIVVTLIHYSLFTVNIYPPEIKTVHGVHYHTWTQESISRISHATVNIHQCVLPSSGSTPTNSHCCKLIW